MKRGKRRHQLHYTRATEGYRPHTEEEGKVMFIKFGGKIDKIVSESGGGSEVGVLLHLKYTPKGANE